MLNQITPLVLTYNEATNIDRTLDRLSWAEEIVVVDSGSEDGTRDLASSRPAVRLFVRESFPHIADQWNFGLDQVRTPWVLTLDADYRLSTGLIDELRALEPDRDAYAARFRYCVGGRPLRATLYPDRVVLFRPSKARYYVDGHTQALATDVEVGKLKNPIDHDDRKPLSRWLDNQRRYAAQEVDKLVAADPGELSLADRVRRRGLAPLVMPAYCLFGKRLLLDGRAGWRYTLERTYAEVLLALALAERRHRSGDD